ncbi:uncharacterized protein LOC117304830 [Asterias rubens]|uniref:uncharacterized protein LOC117304830 n=1 Tax=Asterias rubens TaxID=7604 RepID=UPI001455D0C1|nr:uncharacterized protein LOC117304830 [Asterias rubens]
MKGPILVGFGAVILTICTHCVVACRRSTSVGPVAPTRGQEQLTDPIADVWFGELPFLNYMCGWPNKTTTGMHVPANNHQIINPFDLVPDNIKPFHTLVYFRGDVFEWGAGLMRSYENGTLGRDPHGCPIKWTLPGQSNCTTTEIKQVASTYLTRFGRYDLLLNNCHNFSRRLIEKLLRGECSPF